MIRVSSRETLDNERTPRRALRQTGVISRGIDAERREEIRARVRLESSAADRRLATVGDLGLRKRVAVASINIAAIEAFFLNDPKPRTAEDEQLWLDAADYWFAIHVSALRSLEHDADILAGTCAG